MTEIVCFMVEPYDEITDVNGVEWFRLRRVDTGEPVGVGISTGLYRDIPDGAMMLVKHYENSHHRPGPVKDGDQDHLLVKTPGGVWCTGCPATQSGAHWSVEGEPPRVTAHPSIISGDYHGWLRDGKLIPV